MYTDLENVQIIISLLKQYGIKKLVLSPGNRDVPLVHSVETDSFFECYSIVDERSAAFFALGLSDASKEPVGFVCTSSTASCNYMPAIEEAHLKKIPLLALTADREHYFYLQLEDQKIMQNNMYGGYVQYCADLPVIRNENDKWLCERIVNEALSLLCFKNYGPVQINFQINRTDQFSTSLLPIARKINCISLNDLADKREHYSNYLRDKKIMVIVGENYYDSDLSAKLVLFEQQYNAVVFADHFSNVNSDSLFLQASKLLEAMTNDEFEKYTPEIVITVGGHIWSSIKYVLRNSKSNFEHWRVSEDGIIRDGFKKMTNTFNCSGSAFFNELTNKTILCNNHNYKKIWSTRNNRLVDIDTSVFTNYYAISELCRLIPSGSIVHTSILNSARLNAFSKYDNPSIRTYCNFGADGIDGCLSTFIGECSNKPSEIETYLIIGDLSAIYDMNAIKQIEGTKLKIMIINNHSGSEFHTSFGIKRYPLINVHMAAGHNTNLGYLISDSLDIKYLCSSDIKSFKDNLKVFVGEKDKAIVFEVMTNAEQDAAVLNRFYKSNRHLSIKNKSRIIAKRIISLLRRRK